MIIYGVWAAKTKKWPPYNTGESVRLSKSNTTKFTLEKEYFVDAFALLAGLCNHNKRKWGNARQWESFIHSQSVFKHDLWLYNTRYSKKQMLIHRLFHYLLDFFFFDFIWSLHFVLLIIGTEILCLSLLSKHH